MNQYFNDGNCNKLGKYCEGSVNFEEDNKQEFFIKLDNNQKKNNSYVNLFCNYSTYQNNQKKLEERNFPSKPMKIQLENDPQPTRVCQKSRPVYNNECNKQSVDVFMNPGQGNYCNFSNAIDTESDLKNLNQLLTDCQKSRKLFGLSDKQQKVCLYKDQFNTQQQVKLMGKTNHLENLKQPGHCDTNLSINQYSTLPQMCKYKRKNSHQLTIGPIRNDHYQETFWNNNTSMKMACSYIRQ